MIDSIIAGTGNSRYLRSSIPAGTTWDDVLTMLRAGTFPIDLAGINADGFTTLGTALNAENLLASATITALGLSSDATPDDALNALITAVNEKLAANQGAGNAGKIMGVNSDGSVKYIGVDSTVTEDSTNLIESGAVFDAVKDKVDAAGAAAAAPVQSVAGKTGAVTLDADDVAYDPDETYSDGTIGNGLNDANETILKAFPTDTASGAIASFSDGGDGIPVKALTVDMEPVQDLNGYDNPWPAGGGKNLLQLDDVTNKAIGSSGVSATIANGEITFSGTSTAGGGRTTRLSPYFTLKAGTYILSPALNTGAYVRGYLNKRADSTVVGNYSGNSFTISEDVEVYYGIGISSGYDYSGIKVKPQLETGSTITSWVPYSNICPISGHTAVNVYRTGKNLLDMTVYNGGVYSPTVGSTLTLTKAETAKQFVPNSDHTAYTVSSTANNQTFTLLMPLKDGENYYANITIAGGTAARTSLLYLDRDFEVLSRNNNTNNPQTRKLALSPDAGAAYVALVITNSTATTETITVTNPMIHLGTAEADYEPYSGTTIPITIPTPPGTVYGGTLDVVTGVLTVDRAATTFNGSEAWGNYSTDNPNGTCFRTAVSGFVGWSSGAKDYLLCNCFKVTSMSSPDQDNAEANSFWINNAGDGLRFIWGEPNQGSTVAEFKTWLSSNNVTVVAKLTTPQTYQLSEQGVINTLLGQNNVWADTGDVTVEYRADPSLYVDKKIADSQAVMELIITANRESGMTASRAYSSGDLIIVSGKLYRATTSIANGATLTVGTNVSLTTVAAEIAAI